MQDLLPAHGRASYDGDRGLGGTGVSCPIGLEA